jgi:hypothetical protein
MQDRYVCDVGDFAKYSLLTALAEADLRLGVVWYLNTLQENNNDGGITDYPALRNCNERIHSALQRVLQAGSRNLAAIEQSDILPPSTRFFSRPLPASPQRQSWLAEAAEAVREAEIVFLDPDNGLPESPNAYNRSPQKYASFGEVAYFRKRQLSVVIYQHQTRSGTFEEQLERHCTTIRRMGAPEVWVLTFHRFSSRAFIVIPSDSNAPALQLRCRRFIQSAWGREGHFRFRIHKAHDAIGSPVQTTVGLPKAVTPSSSRTFSRDSKGTTDQGYTNKNGQTVVRATGLPGTDFGQRVYVLGCGSCGREYGANGSDIFQRRCPWCQRGKPGLPIR